MCTSIVMESLDGKHFLSRTMDFGFDLEATPSLCPRKYHWKSATDGSEFIGDYSLVGAGRNLGQMLFTDGVNEHGLSCAALYLPGESTYEPTTKAGKINLAPHEFLLWILTSCKSIEDLSDKLDSINLVDTKVPLLGIVTPLHWIMTDNTGKCVVIEPHGSPLEIITNPVKVLTNTPKLEWHISNLRNFIGIKPEQFASRKFGDFEATPFSQASGTSLLQGGFTPPERFVRAAYLKEYIDEAKNEEEAITNIWHVLNSVRIPRGVVMKNDGNPDITQYVASMCSESKTYYFTPYQNSQISCVTLTQDYIENGTAPIPCGISKNQEFKWLNKS